MGPKHVFMRPRPPPRFYHVNIWRHHVYSTSTSTSPRSQSKIAFVEDRELQRYRVVIRSTVYSVGTAKRLDCQTEHFQSFSPIRDGISVPGMLEAPHTAGEKRSWATRFKCKRTKSMKCWLRCCHCSCCWWEPLRAHAVKNANRNTTVCTELSMRTASCKLHQKHKLSYTKRRPLLCLLTQSRTLLLEGK